MGRRFGIRNVKSPCRSGSLNTPKSLDVLTAKIPEDYGQSIVQANWLSLRFLSNVQRKSGFGSDAADNAEKLRGCPIVHEDVLLLKSHMFQVKVKLSP
jgi:hypothetical protein